MSSAVLDSLRAARGWINYNPGPPFDFLAGAHPATEEQLAVELDASRGVEHVGQWLSVAVLAHVANDVSSRAIPWRLGLWFGDAILDVEKRGGGVRSFPRVERLFRRRFTDPRNKKVPRRHGR
ncbi:MAG TPA: hypothetical protein VM121_03420 [Acidimicrobiales bacterium]|nr:hypothetical protein [Acidimicrobiales bacterium]